MDNNNVKDQIIHDLKRELEKTKKKIKIMKKYLREYGIDEKSLFAKEKDIRPEFWPP